MRKDGAGVEEAAAGGGRRDAEDDAAEQWPPPVETEGRGAFLLSMRIRMRQPARAGARFLQGRGEMRRDLSRCHRWVRVFVAARSACSRIPLP